MKSNNMDAETVAISHELIARRMTLNDVVCYYDS